jgi:hypothetical protein
MTIIMSLPVCMRCMDLTSKVMTDRPGIRTNDEIVDLIRNLQNEVDILLNKNSLLSEQENRKCGNADFSKKSQFAFAYACDER